MTCWLQPWYWSSKERGVKSKSILIAACKKRKILILTLKSDSKCGSRFSGLCKARYPLKPVFAEVSFTSNHHTALVLPASVTCVRDWSWFDKYHWKLKKYSNLQGGNDLFVSPKSQYFLFLHIEYVEENNKLKVYLYFLFPLLTPFTFSNGCLKECLFYKYLKAIVNVWTLFKKRLKSRVMLGSPRGSPVNNSPLLCLSFEKNWEKMS